MLINSNNVGIWGIIQICKIIARMWQFSFLLFMRYSFLPLTRSLGCTCTMRPYSKASKPILRTVSPVSQNLYVEYLIQIHIFLAMKYASFGHSAYCRKHFRRFSHLRATYGKSLQNFCQFSLHGNTNFD